jgi:phosphoribosylglycinamide formyltransferase-1
MRDFFQKHAVELIVDAGYDRVHTLPLLDAFEDRIINLHPSLLPEFAGGMDAVERAIESGAKVTGATVHVVTGDVDAGPILVQEAVPIVEGDTVETLPLAIGLMEAKLAKSSTVG